MEAKIAIIGAGSVGKSLANQILLHKRPIKFITRDPTSPKSQELAKAYQGQAEIGTLQEVMPWADVAILCIPALYTDEAVQKFVAEYKDSLADKILIDATNAMDYSNTFDHKAWRLGRGTLEELQDLLPGTKCYKAFNTVGFEQMDPQPGSKFGVSEPSMMYCGPKEGKEIVEQVVEAAGWKPVYVGGVRYSRNLEAIAELWIHMVYINGHHRNFHINFAAGDP